MILKDKVAVVTGASDGIGKQVSLKLAKEKVKLVLIGRNELRLKEAQDEALKLGTTKVKTYLCDIRLTKELIKTVNSIIADFQNINILINVAGIWQKMSPVEDIKEDVIDDVIQTNITSLIHCTRLLLPNLKKQKEAAIINVSSKSGVVAQAGQSVYTASKYGVRGFTDVLKIDLKGSNVRVAGIYQGGTNTRMFAKVGDSPPIEKFTKPEDLADVIVYMLSRPKQIWLHEVRVEY